MGFPPLKQSQFPTRATPDPAARHRLSRVDTTGLSSFNAHLYRSAVELERCEAIVSGTYMSGVFGDHVPCPNINRGIIGWDASSSANTGAWGEIDYAECPLPLPFPFPPPLPQSRRHYDYAP
ncbi:unnamed protein product, partial [Iphiclides podalirius]